jgi:hypothetical protein
MGRQTRLLFGISVFWLELSVLFDGINSLVLPFRISGVANPHNQATIFGWANFSTTGAAAAAGFFGLVIDAFDRISPSLGFSVQVAAQYSGYSSQYL